MPTFAESIIATDRCMTSSTGRLVCESPAGLAMAVVVALLALTLLLPLGVDLLARRRRRR
ncbi:hypothetical protein [Actinosynnema sp. NPDC023587]|uniref:hypothetical protein n=1 Tax=Actinosynnema sp. NPDC023587 TaxID=3154695 RepID=UPI0033BFD251